jgi:hypothetical protein
MPRRLANSTNAHSVLVSRLLRCSLASHAEKRDWVRLANDLLLLPEEIDPATGAYLGNYPLALSQAGLVHAVIEVQKVLESKPADGVDITDHSRRIGNPTAPRAMSGS